MPKEAAIDLGTFPGNRLILKEQPRMQKDKSTVPWPVWVVVTILVAVIGAYARIYPPPDPPSSTGTPVISSQNGNSAFDISGTYLMDQLAHRVIIVTDLSGSSFRIEEPSGSYPWHGTATLDGGSLSGEAKFADSLVRIRVEGQIRADGSIKVQYIYLTDDQGNPRTGRRVDHHIWYRTS
jgi:hypothetical protein